MALVVGIGGTEAKHDLAVALESRGAWCLAIGIAIAALQRDIGCIVASWIIEGYVVQK